MPCRLHGGMRYLGVNFGDDLRRKVEAAAALRRLTEVAIDRLRAANPRFGDGTNVAVAVAIANADVHESGSLQRMRIIVK